MSEKVKIEKVKKVKPPTKKELEKEKLEKGTSTCDHSISSKGVLITKMSSKKKFTDEDLIKYVLDKCKLENIGAPVDKISELILSFEGASIESEVFTLTIKSDENAVVAKKILKKTYNEEDDVARFLSDAK